MFPFFGKLFQYKTKREKVEATAGVDKNSSALTQQPVTTATTAEDSMVRPLLLYSFIVYEAGTKNIEEIWFSSWG